MRVAIFGLGYVGSVSAGCLAHKGNQVIGVDIDQNKVNLINSGESTIVENGLDDLIASAVNSQMLRATSDVREAVENSELAIICVGTPNREEGHLDMSYINKVAEQIAAVLKEKKGFYTIAIRSTVMPGTNAHLSDLVSQLSGRKIDTEFAIISNPEFLREGNAIMDFFDPPYTVLGTNSKKGLELINELYSFLDAPVKEVSVEVAEMIKFLNNSYHALKVAFANEVGRLCKPLGVDSHKLMELFVADEHLNISPKYFKPGFAYGGSCLPKDLKALKVLGHDNYVRAPIFDAISKSNDHHMDYIFSMIQSKGLRSVHVVGLSFKDNTDDLRFSPSLALCERLAGKGYNVSIFDENVNLSKLVGKNKDYLMNHLPHIDSLLETDINAFIEESELIVFVHPSKLFLENLDKIPKSAIIIDLINQNSLTHFVNYQGVGW